MGYQIGSNGRCRSTRPTKRINLALITRCCSLLLLFSNDFYWHHRQPLGVQSFRCSSTPPRKRFSVTKSTLLLLPTLDRSTTRKKTIFHQQSAFHRKQTVNTRPTVSSSSSWIIQSKASPSADGNEINKEEGDDNSTDDDDDEFYNPQNTLTLVGGQALLIGVAAALAAVLGTPNYGFGPGMDISLTALQFGTIAVTPLVGFAVFLDTIEDRYVALQDVTKATQRSVLALMGGTYRPIVALCISVVLGIVAGWGEELLFRGVFQYETISRLGIWFGVLSTSIVFGLLHAVTPMYAFLATIASIYFGGLYVFTDNLLVPITCHTIYDIGALFYAHWTVCQLTLDEQRALTRWEGPGSSTE